MFADPGTDFDSQVITLRGRSQLLPREDPMTPQRLPKSLLIKESRYDWDARATAVRRNGNGEVVVILEDGSQVDGDDLPVATGRAPVTADLGLPAGGVEITDRGFIRVDNLRTTADHVWVPVA
jgi:pyruvate/2-oxoglutarate dehydrogenase complex dihydrolipoamide dehydrogenase (E3) component